ncbi:hypothetical protein HY407_01220 [Candidatus Gottesmanbacteria bacterium]|nr:hypothetical protein [Candidatus Gottesmanbacteria bacterium]
MPTPTPCPTGVEVCIADFFAPARKFGNLGEMVSILSKNIVLVAGVIFFILILIAGFGVISAAGSEDAQKMEKNKGYLTYAVIGFVIIFGAYWVLQIINAVTGGALGDIFQ